MVEVHTLLLGIIFLIFFVAFLVVGIAGATKSHAPPECGDSSDNDNDGLTDRIDPGCHNDFIADNDDSYESKRSENSDELNKICKEDKDCKNNKDGHRCMMTYPGNFVPFCGCTKNSDCNLGDLCGDFDRCS